MKTTALAAIASLLFVVTGCSSQRPEPTPEQKKEMMGGPMPKDWMEKNVKPYSNPGAKGAPTGAPSANGQG